MDYENSYVGFIDILGFKKHFIENKNNDREILLTLLEKFSEQNGEYFDIETDDQRSLRSSALCFSDNIVFSRPAEFDKNNAQDYFRKLIAFFRAASFFAHEALSKGYLIRGALAYGPFCQKNGIIIGMPLIEAAAHEKIANYPRIILTPSFIEKFGGFSESGSFGRDREKTLQSFHLKKDEADGIMYFDYLRHYHELSNVGGDEGRKNLSLLVATMKQALSNIELQIKVYVKDLYILAKLNWAKLYFEKFLEEIEIQNDAAIREFGDPR